MTHGSLSLRRTTVRQGYTLAEVLIASVLVATLMGACWNMMSLYGDFLSAGRRDITERQLGRSFFGLIRDDLRLVCLPDRRFDPPPLPEAAPSLVRRADPTDGPAPIGGFPEPTSRESLESGTPVDPSVALVGSATSLRITFPASIESIDQAGSLPEQDSFDDQRSREMRTILYEFVAPESTLPTDERLSFGLHRLEVTAFDLEQAVDAQRQLGDVGGVGGGFGRTAFDLLMAPADQELDSLGLSSPEESVGEPQFQPVHEHAPEVVRCEFEFHDGNRWISGWNSRGRRAMPGAVRLTLWIINADELEALQRALAVTGGRSDDAQADPEAFPGIRPRRQQRIITLSPHFNPAQPAGGIP